MAIRTTEEEVQAVVEVSSDINVLPYIDIATILVDKIVECAAERGQTLSDTQLRVIEAYLAAYFYSGRDPRYTKKKTERAEASFTVPVYWEMAKRLDTSGCLDSFGRDQHYIEFAWLGKPPSDQIDYVDRD